MMRLMRCLRLVVRMIWCDDGENLLIAYRRAANILKIEEKKDSKRYDGNVDEAAFEQDEEHALYAGLAETGPAIAHATAEEDFAGAMTALAALRGPVDAFFDKVTVNADVALLRENRLKLLNEIRVALEGVADFSKIEG